ncbi:MAG TPA: hypothetical protein VFY87_12575, partial [Geminicoccaceae bacterium]|nr:hypothetical protein [Geminicoccaceae bacterium]
WNVMTLGRPAGEVLAAFAALCRRAVAQVLRILSDRARGQSSLPAGVPVLTFEGLRREVEARDQGEAARVAELARSVAARGLDLPEQCRLITERCWAASGRSGPAVVVGFASMPYLPTGLRDGEGRRLEAAARAAARRVGERHGTPIGFLGHFPGISDMSFLGQVGAASLPAIAANTPAWGHGIDWPAETPAALDVPAVNIGPWGRDFHMPLERLHTPYAFGVLPELLLETVREILRP